MGKTGDKTDSQRMYEKISRWSTMSCKERKGFEGIEICNCYPTYCKIHIEIPVYFDKGEFPTYGLE